LRASQLFLFRAILVLETVQRIAKATRSRSLAPVMALVLRNASQNVLATGEVAVYAPDLAGMQEKVYAAAVAPLESIVSNEKLKPEQRIDQLAKHAQQVLDLRDRVHRILSLGEGGWIGQ
jgi:hypothetical protein